jgi:hypothetical protein
MKTIMVDLDDTIVSFSEMFCDKWNQWVTLNHGNYLDSSLRLRLENITQYNYTDCIYEFYKKKDTLMEYQCISCIVDKFMDELFLDTTLYNHAYISKDCEKIFDLLENKYHDYIKVLHTKNSTLEMIVSKTNFIKQCQKYHLNVIDFSVFDKILFELETDNYPKDTRMYDVIIDDSPKNIEYYLNNNKDGKVYMPLKPFNKHLHNSDKRIITL